ncbi:hypothetical protein B0H19DRAFT_154327 [Mycena capillaripes]|nr:hypothetical protein B0H19DRAFT_154327 [Mycena capillaripes]
MNHLSVQGISLSSLGVEVKDIFPLSFIASFLQNFDIFLDVNDRFLISINPPQSMDPTGDQQPQDNITRSWSVFNALCQRVLRSANRVLYNENIERTPIIPDTPRRPPVTQKSMSSTALAPPESSVPTSSQNAPENEASILPRREYVWRTIERGQQSLAAIASRIGLDLDMQLSTSLNKLTSSDARNAHRCAGYSREEITLATTTSDSAVVFHDAPSPREICLVCREVVGVQEVFRCICGNPDPGSRPTVKCQTCKCWSHSDCVRSSNNFTCPTCVPDFTYNLPVVISDDEALERKADIFRLEANQWRLRAGITAIQKPRRLDGHLPARQFLEEAVDSLQREVNEWRARAGVPTIQEPDYTQEAETLRREANEWRLRAGITAIGELPRHLDGHLPARQFLEEAVDSLQREVNEWRARAGVFSIQEHQAEALRREANQWRMRAGVLSAPEPFGPRHFKNEANSFREEVNKWRARAGIRGVDALPEMAVQVFEDSEPRSGASSIIPSDILEPSAQNDEPTIFSGGTETLTTRVGLSDLVQPATSQPSVSLLAASRSWDYGDGKEDRGITSSSERNTKWMENQSDLTGFEPAQEFFKHYTGTERPTDGRGPLQLEDYVDNEIQLPLLSLFPSSSSGDHAGSPKKYVPSAHGGGTISPFLTHSPT